MKSISCIGVSHSFAFARGTALPRLPPGCDPGHVRPRTRPILPTCTPDTANWKERTARAAAQHAAQHADRRLRATISHDRSNLHPKNRSLDRPCEKTTDLEAKNRLIGPTCAFGHIDWTDRTKPIEQKRAAHRSHAADNSRQPNKPGPPLRITPHLGSAPAQRINQSACHPVSEHRPANPRGSQTRRHPAAGSTAGPSACRRNPSHHGDNATKRPVSYAASQSGKSPVSQVSATRPQPAKSR